MKRNILLLIFLALLPALSLSDVAFKEIKSKEILAAGPEWQENYDRYQPAAELIASLKSRLGSGLRIDVYLGLWCPDSKNNVPPFLKILDRIDTPVAVRYFSVQRKPSKAIPYYVDSVRIERVPTFVFYRGDTEIGRIVENPKAGLLEDVMKIIAN
jgi:hypothetical protein